MRWIDIDVTRPSDETADLLGVVAARRDELPRLQKDVGLDSPVIVRHFEEQGRRLFEVVREPLKKALATVDADETVGLQIVVTPDLLDLPWHALHNGLHFLIEKTPLCATTTPLNDDPADDEAAWKRRWRETRLTEAALGPAAAEEIVSRYRPEPCAEPEILYVDGRGDASDRSERDRVGVALGTACGAVRLARLGGGDAEPSPAGLMKRGPYYQAIHFRGETDRPTPRPDDGPWNRLDEAPEADREILGVDPVTALLDEVGERMARREEEPLRPRAATSVAVADPAWELADGPVRPEDLGRNDAAPPLVFSNSHLSLSAFGARFLAAGTQVFVGTGALVRPTDARDVSDAFYRRLAEGESVAEALREAALDARARLGAHHPLWLSYGVVGAGALALQFL